MMYSDSNFDDAKSETMTTTRKKNFNQKKKKNNDLAAVWGAKSNKITSTTTWILACLLYTTTQVAMIPFFPTFICHRFIARLTEYNLKQTNKQKLDDKIKTKYRSSNRKVLWKQSQ